MTKCPVCGAEVDVAAIKAQTGTTGGGAREMDPKAGTRQFHDGEWFYFDTIECRNNFTMQPERYLPDQG